MFTHEGKCTAPEKKEAESLSEHKGNRCWECGLVDKNDGVTPLHSRISLVDLYKCRILLQNRHTYRHTQAQTCTHLHPVQIHQHAYTLVGVLAKEHMGTQLDGSKKARGLKDKREEVWEKNLSSWNKSNHKCQTQIRQTGAAAFFTCACCNNMNTIKNPP